MDFLGSFWAFGHVVAGPFTPCSAFWGKPQISRQTLQQTVIKGLSTREGAQVSISAAKSLSRQALCFGLIRKFTFFTAIYFHGIKQIPSQTLWVLQQSQGIKIIPHLISDPVVFSSDKDVFPCISFKHRVKNITGLNLLLPSLAQISYLVLSHQRLGVG
jgi:hypothetical protein